MPFEATMYNKSGFIERLHALFKVTYGTRYAFEKRTETNHSTVSRWVSPEARLPNGDNLAEISMQTLVSLDWLMFGEGPMFRRVSREPASLSADLRETILSELVRRGLPEQDVTQYLQGGEELLSMAIERAWERVEEMSRWTELWLSEWQSRTVVEDDAGGIELEGVDSTGKSHSVLLGRKRAKKK
jgi:hypothetical protein